MKDLPDKLAKVLATYVAERAESLSSREAIREILLDWFIAYGYLPAPEEREGSGHLPDPTSAPLRVYGIDFSGGSAPWRPRVAAPTVWIAELAVSPENLRLVQLQPVQALARRALHLNG
jgi:hypothetical protein